MAFLAGAIALTAGAAPGVQGARAAGAPGADPVAAGFRNVPPEARLRMFWRIFGPAWSREEIDYQLDLLQQAGVGGVMTCFTYPVALDDPARGIRNQAFLSPEFLETLGYAARRAPPRGQEFGVCGGTGWPFGGPSVSVHDAAQRLRVEVLKPLPDGRGYALPPLRDGGHLAGKKVIGAEAWTWTGLPNRLADSLSDLKLCSDLHFLSGENELTGVDFPYSPRSVEAPGWTPYYGPVLNQNNPQWFCFPYLAAYASRCQWLLRQGEPVADVALYTPTEDAFAHGPADQMLLDFHLRDRLATGELTDEFGLDKAFRHHSDVVYSLLSHGYNFDGIDFFAVNRLARVRGGELRAGDGRYRIVVLPNLEGMEPAALEKLARFCRSGGTLIATRRLPSRVYGLHSEKATGQLQALVAELFGPGAGASFSARAYGKGRAIFTPDEREGLAAALAQSGVTPDLRVTPLQAEVSHVHRRPADRDLYFVANVGAAEARFTADCRVERSAAALWDPLSGTITPVPILARGGGRTQVALTLPSRGSVFLCFTDDARAVSGGGGEPVRAEAASATSGPSADDRQPITMPLEIPWRVAFDGPDAPPPVETRELNSWTGWPGARYFSGCATYTGSFELPSDAPCLRPAASCRLRFGQVHEVAEVVVNGRRAGAIWLPPYELEIAPYLKPGTNTLQITVGNLSVNRVLGLPDPDLTALRAVYGERFPAPEEKKLMAEPAPSGLIGPAVLLTAGSSVPTMSHGS